MQCINRNRSVTDTDTARLTTPLPYMVINVHGNIQGGRRGTEHQKTRIIRKISNLTNGGRKH